MHWNRSPSQLWQPLLPPTETSCLFNDPRTIEIASSPSQLLPDAVLSIAALMLRGYGDSIDRSIDRLG